MKNSFLFLSLAVVLLGAGCGAQPAVLTNEPSVSSAADQIKQEVYASKYFPGLSFSLPTGYQVEDGTSSKWVAVKKGEVARLEIFRMQDFGDRAFGFEGESVTQKEIDVYMPKEQLKKAGFDVWVYYEKGDVKTQAELAQIVDSIAVK